MTVEVPIRSRQYRSATQEDVEAIAVVWHDGWREAHLGHLPVEIERYRRLTDFRELAAGRLGSTVVAAVGQDVVGFVVVHHDEVEQLYVASSARGSGVADDLLRRGEQLIAARFTLAWLAVISANPRARRFYERNGWHDSGSFSYEAPAGTGTMAVAAQRYEKQLYG